MPAEAAPTVTFTVVDEKPQDIADLTDTDRAALRPLVDNEDWPVIESGGPLVPEEPRPQPSETLLSFFDPDAIVDAFKTSGWTLREHIDIAWQIAKTAPKNADRLAALKYMDDKMELAMKLAGLWTERRRIVEIDPATGKTTIRGEIKDHGDVPKLGAHVREMLDQHVPQRTDLGSHEAPAEHLSGPEGAASNLGQAQRLQEQIIDARRPKAEGTTPEDPATTDEPLGDPHSS